MKYLKILILLSTLFFISCFYEKKENLEKYYNFINPEFGKEVMLDFSKNGIDLIKDIENQIKEDLCESNSKLKGSLLIQKEKTSFPLVAYKYCQTHVHYNNRIPILINLKNEVLINNTIIKPFDSIEYEVFNATEKLKNIENLANIVYLISWDIEINPTLIKERLNEIFIAAKQYSNKISLEKYDKRFDELNESELKKLKKNTILL
ncbi:MAG: hypothetical protein QM499_09395 [Flavobacteriaceae bacterium]